MVENETRNCGPQNDKNSPINHGTTYTNKSRKNSLKSSFSIIRTDNLDLLSVPEKGIESYHAARLQSKADKRENILEEIYNPLARQLSFHQAQKIINHSLASNVATGGTLIDKLGTLDRLSSSTFIDHYHHQQIVTESQSIHIDSAGLYESFSPAQKLRQQWVPSLPNILKQKNKVLYMPGHKTALVYNIDKVLHGININYNKSVVLDVPLYSPSIEDTIVPVSDKKSLYFPGAEFSIDNHNELANILPEISDLSYCQITCFANMEDEDKYSNIDADITSDEYVGDVTNKNWLNTDYNRNLTDISAARDTYDDSGMRKAMQNAGVKAGNHKRVGNDRLSSCVIENACKVIKPLKIGIVLSGGPAPGGHNVIAGLYDAIKELHEESQIYGFIGGLDGLFDDNYKVVTDEIMNLYRNMGGFNMLWSGRGKVENEDDLKIAWNACERLDLNGLVIIGGDGSNSNAALLANYFSKKNKESSFYNCSVVGVPKTIDGDLKSPAVEISFGFDTAARTYSEQIGNLCVDVLTTQKTYHFVRIMGRSASHLMLECALQCHPNLFFIGEEIKKKNKTLKSISDEIVDMIIDRAKMGKSYGIILIPEGLIEFIPEMAELIENLNFAYIDNTVNEELLGENGKKLWNFLPEIIRNQLLSDRESTGYIQVAKIATEKLLIIMTERELMYRLARKPSYDIPVEVTDSGKHNKSHQNFEYSGLGSIDLDVKLPQFRAHYFGYEGRCAMPTNFDLKYCYALGYTAATLIQHRRNGYLAVVRGLCNKTCMWVCGGVPFVQLMTVVSMKNTSFPAMRRSLVEVEDSSQTYRLLNIVRDIWKMGDFYRIPGPIQFYGPEADSCCFTVREPQLRDLLGDCCKDCITEDEMILMARNEIEMQKQSAYQMENIRHICDAEINSTAVGHLFNTTFIQHKSRLLGHNSALQNMMLLKQPVIPAVCTDINARARPAKQLLHGDMYSQKQVIAHFPYLCKHSHFYSQEVITDCYTPPVQEGMRIGVVFITRQSPGTANVLTGIASRLKLIGGTCYAFYGLDGLIATALDGMNNRKLLLSDASNFVKYNEGLNDAKGSDGSKDNESEINYPGKYIILTEEIANQCLNMGGIELIGRDSKYSLNDVKVQNLVMKACKMLSLDGLIFPGSAAAITDAANLAEVMLRKNMRTSIVTIPCTGSNNMCNKDHIETCVGFDSSTKVYSTLIGNILTDAASMPKYWHFIRLMGRQPSHEVLECALQCHPNVVIIAEEYGAANLTLFDVITDIADVVCQRASMGKNFGTVLIPDSLLMHLPTMKVLLSELEKILAEAISAKIFPQVQELLINIDIYYSNYQFDISSFNNSNSTWSINNSDSSDEKIDAKISTLQADLFNDKKFYDKWLKKISPWSLALFSTFPKFIRRELVSEDIGELRFEHLETEQLISQMVQKELADRAQCGLYGGKFQCVTHFFGYQGRSSMPSSFDASLAHTYGHLACILIESGLTGYCCSIRGLCGDARDWHCGAVPITSLMKVVPGSSTSVSGMIPLMSTGTCDILSYSSAQNSSSQRVSDPPIVPTSEVSLKGKAFLSLKTAYETWKLNDAYCNPGPIQFWGKTCSFVSRALFEEHGEYHMMLRRVECYADILKDTCRFGVSEDLLKQAYVSLNNLLALSFHSNNIMEKVPEIISVEVYDEWAKRQGHRPSPHSNSADITITTPQ